MPGQTNSSVFKSYLYTDTTFNEGLWYYRLKQVDHDEQFTYSKIISVNHAAHKKEIVIYPNPSYDGRFTVAAAETQLNGVYIYSLDFKLIKKIITTDINTLEVSIQELADGAYYILLTEGEKQIVKRIEKFCSAK